MKLWYDHYRRSDNSEVFEVMLDDAIIDAINSGQIKKHEITGKTNADNAHVFTTCRVLDHSGKAVATGYAFCTDEIAPGNRRAAKKMGRTIARGRIEKLFKKLFKESDKS